VCCDRASDRRQGFDGFDATLLEDL
jgi:hypothetical protein